MTFRNLPEKDKAGLDAKKALALMLAKPSMIKRPVLDLGGGKLLVGFTPELYARERSPRRTKSKFQTRSEVPLDLSRSKVERTNGSAAPHRTFTT